MNTNDIRRQLEAEYDIPFVVHDSFDKGEPSYIIGPENKAKELFTVRITFRNKVRLNMDFQPEKYSAQFIESMASQPMDSRNRFIAYASLLNNKGAKTDIKVNDLPLDLTNAKQWPETWRSCQIHVTKLPVLEDGMSYHDEAYKWGSMMIGMILSLADIVPVEDEDIHQVGYAEGSSKQVAEKRYERNPLNRKLCLAAKGYDCAICGMNFEKKYGDLGHNFIHVHHVVPVSKLGAGYVIDPLKDLIPVCPNCHAMLHRVDPPMLPDVLRDTLK